MIKPTYQYFSDESTGAQYMMTQNDLHSLLFIFDTVSGYYQLATYGPEPLYVVCEVRAEWRHEQGGVSVALDLVDAGCVPTKKVDENWIRTWTVLSKPLPLQAAIEFWDNWLNPLPPAVDFREQLRETDRLLEEIDATLDGRLDWPQQELSWTEAPGK